MKTLKESGLICERPDGIHPKTNITHSIRHHSPDGFEWGCEGAGPLELALNVMNELLPIESDESDTMTVGSFKVSYIAYKLHHRFKWDFIEKIPKEGGHIPIETINKWIEEQMGITKLTN